MIPAPCGRCGWIRPWDCTCLTAAERGVAVKPPRSAAAATKLPTPRRGPANGNRPAENESGPDLRLTVLEAIAAQRGAA